MEAVYVRRAAHLSLDEAPVPVPPACAGLPDRDASCRSRVAPRTSSFFEDARAGGPSEGRVTVSSARSRMSWLHTRKSVCRRRSPPWRPPSTRCHRRDIVKGGVPTAEPLRSSVNRAFARLGGSGPCELDLTTFRTDRGLRSGAFPRRKTPSRKPGCLRPLRFEFCSRSTSRSRRPHAAVSRADGFDGHCKRCLRRHRKQARTMSFGR